MRAHYLFLTCVLIASSAWAEGSIFDGLKVPLEKQPRANKPYHYQNGMVYTGEWSRGLPQGDGRVKLRSGEEYMGRFWHGLPRGIGLFEDVEGNFYKGEWLDGHMEGRGIMKYANGTVYQGDWANDKREGKGRLTFPSGARYDGSWHNDMKHGQGELRYPDGARYVGDYAVNMPHGYGSEVDASGNVYAGTFSKGKRHGVGDCTSSDGSTRICAWKHGTEITDAKVLERAKLAKKDLSPQFSFDGGLTMLFENLNTHQKGLVKETDVTYWTKASLLFHELHIDCKGARGFLSITVADYKGPGNYVLKKEEFIASVDGDNALAPLDDGKAVLTITGDADGILDATFSTERVHIDGDSKKDAYAIRQGRFSAQIIR